MAGSDMWLFEGEVGGEPPVLPVPVVRDMVSGMFVAYHAQYHELWNGRVTEKHGDAARELRLGSLLFVQSEGARKELSTNGMVSMINALAHWRHEPFTAKNSRRLGFLPDASPAVRTRVFLESWKGLTPFHDCIDVVPAQDTQALALQLAPDIIVSYDSIRNIHFRAGQEPSAEQ